MCVKQNALDFAMDFPLAFDAVKDNFYVDNGLTGADSVEEAVRLYMSYLARQMQMELE